MCNFNIFFEIKFESRELYVNNEICEINSYIKYFVYITNGER